MEIGDTISQKFKATNDIVKQIAITSGDYNPIHLDEQYAGRTVFKRRIAHGLFCLNCISNIIGNKFPGPGTILLEQSFKYKKAVYIDDEIEIFIKVIDKEDDKDRYVLGINCVNQNSQIVLEGTTIVRWQEG